jgi:hypothetical protein
MTSSNRCLGSVQAWLVMDTEWPASQHLQLASQAFVQTNML